MIVHLFTATIAASLPTISSRQIWECDATAGAFAITLPDATLCVGAQITAIKTDAGANAVTISRAGAQTILGTAGAAQTSLSLATLGKSFTLESNGTNWRIIDVV